MWRVARSGSPEVLRATDSSPYSAETSFRELDEVFLQTQTRIWLGEVLHIRFDEDVGIADLLADGELLFQVSKEVWKMLLRKHGELKHSKVHIYERTSSGKSDGRYMPYPKLDSFLKICQILGLTGIDLFSPSDVVEKRDIRRVCMCIRSVSKKARSKKLNVPDFDIVTYTIAMPTHLVGGIRRSLELSQCSPSSFSASSPWNDAREICGLKFRFGQHSQHSDSRSDESESNFSDLEFGSPFSSASYDPGKFTYIVGETSPELSPTADAFVRETGFSNSMKEAMFAKSVCSCHLSTNEMYALQNLSSTSYSELPIDQDASICFFDTGKGSADSIPMDYKNGLKVEDLVGTLDIETSCQACMNVSSLDVAPSEDNQPSQSSFPSTFSHLEVRTNVEVEPFNTRQKSSFFENAIATYNKAMKSRFYYMETSDGFNSVTPKSYPLDTEAAGNDGNISISGLPSMVSTVSEQQKSPVKDDLVEHTDGLFHDDMSSVDDSDCSGELKMHQSSHDASDSVFLLSDYESKIPTSKKGPAMTLANKESSANPESCQYEEGKMRDIGHQMAKKINSFNAKDFEVLDVMESSDYASTASASEMIPGFDFCRYDLFRSHINILGTKGESFQTVHILPSSTSECREGKEVESHVSYFHYAFAKPSNVQQAILDNTMFQKDAIKPDECGKSHDREGRTVGKTRNQVLKSVAGVITMVGAFVLLLHVRQKKDKGKNNEAWMPFQIQKPNQEFFTRRQVKIGRSGSLYPGEKLRFSEF